MKTSLVVLAALLAPAAARANTTYPKLPDDPSKLDCDWAGCELVQVTDAAKKAIETHPEHEKVVLRFVRGTTDAGLATIKKLPWATRVDLHDGVTDLTPLASLPHLQELSIVDATPSSLAPLVKNTELRRLDIPHGVDLAPLPKLTWLTYVEIDCRNAACIAAVAKLPKLTTLGLRAEDLDATALAPIATLTTLQDLTLMDTALVDLSLIAPLTKLTKLNLQGNAKLKNIDGLTAFPELSWLTIENGNGAKDARVLSKLPKLTTLYAEDTLLPEKAKAKFKKAHPDMTVF